MRRNRPHGFAMLLVLLAVLVCSVVAFAGVSIATLDSLTAAAELRALQSLELARAGISRAVAQLRLDGTWASTADQVFSQSGGSCTVTVYPAPGNAGSSTKVWKVTSVGRFNAASRTVVAWLQLESFARFAWFTDSETSASGSVLWFMNADRITGAAHTNGYFSVSGKPQFGERVTSANSGDAYFNAATFTYSASGAGSDAGRFYHPMTSYVSDYPAALDMSGSFGFYGGQPVIPLPTDTTLVKTNANLIVNGDATFLFHANGTATIQQPSHSDVTVSTSETTIYVDNGTATVSGTVNGRVTLGAKTGIVVTGNLVYADRGVDVLGLITDGNVTVTTSSSVAADVEIDAVIMAPKGCLTVSQYNSGIARGTLHVYGSIIQKVRGPVCTFNQSTSAVITGYAKDYVYDTKLTSRPPLNFPTTGNITVMSFVDMGSLGH